MGGRGATVARRPPPPPAAALVLALLLASACSGPALAQDSPLVAGAPAAGPLPPAPAPAPAPAPVWAGTGAGGGSATGEEYSVQENPGGLPWALLFSDEFQGDSLDLKKWNYLIGGGYEYGLPGYSNGELQYYTSLPENVRVENDVLVIQAQQSDPANPWSATSGRIDTLDKFSVAPTEQYPTVRIEARIKVPQGSALWPAFWLLPQVGAWANSSCIGCGSYGHWAASGEIDVMEAANAMQTLSGSLHYGGAYPANQRASGDVTLQGGASLADDFHVFAIEWEPSQIRWYLDGYNYFTAYSSSTGRDGGWYTSGAGAGPNGPFDSPFYLILNLAVGGPATPFTGYAPLGDTLAQPKQLYVDWVRVHGLPYVLSQAAAAQQAQRRRR